MALTMERFAAHDWATGTAAELVSAGILTADMLPGQPGTGAVMCTYMNGIRLQKGQQLGRARNRNESYRQVIRKGPDRFAVCIGLSRAEIERRYAEEARAELAYLGVTESVPMPWAVRVGGAFAASVVQRQHLRGV